MYKVIKLKTGEMYIAEVKTESEDTLILENPMLIEHKYNTDQTPLFRYIPWQLISEDSTLSISSNDILFSTRPKTDLLDVYQRICISFVPVEDDDDK